MAHFVLHCLQVFPHADILNAGLSVVVTTDNNQEEAIRIRDELLELAWQERENFVYEITPLSDSVGSAFDAADEPGEGPVILLDHYDNTASGGTMDTTEVLREILAQGLEDVAAYGIYDPAAVAQMIEAGIDSEVTVSLGGKMHLDALEIQSSPADSYRPGEAYLRWTLHNYRTDGHRVKNEYGPHGIA